jgi:hypothetical protein
MPEYETGYNETLPPGTYDFAVADAIEKQSQRGNTMIELQIVVKTPDGKNGVRIFDHLTFVPKSFWKIDHFRLSTGEKLVQGQTVRFEAEDCLDRQGRVLLTVDTYQGRDRNKVEDYIDPNTENPASKANASPQTPPPAAPKKEKTLEEEFGDDDIPLT